VSPEGVDTGVSGALTDGTGVSPLTASKVIKDLVADFLLTAAAAIGAGAAMEAFDLGAAIAAPDAVGVAVAGAAIRALYRAILRWTHTP
jgi:hypothetical protein